jgi:aldehyde dehydrogenase (NAD+)
LKGYTKPIEFRRQQLQNFLRGINELKDELEEAMLKDLGRCHFWTELGETSGLISLIKYTLSNLDEFTSDVYYDAPLLLTPDTTRIRYEPLGVGLIFGSWNFPYFVTLKPLVTCIAAGNCAVIKGSELGPHATATMKKFVT